MGKKSGHSMAALVIAAFWLTSFVSGERLFFTGNGSESVKHVGYGQNAVIECQAAGIPSPLVYWTHNGLRISQADQKNFEDKYYENLFNSDDHDLLDLSSTRSRLFLDCMTEDSAGEYTCVAETPDNRITKKFSIELPRNTKHLDREPAQASNDDAGCLKNLQSATPARIYMWTDQRLGYEGATVQLFCRADGRPPPAILWTDRNNQPIRADSKKYTVLTNGDLVIFDVRWSTDMGQYKCVAKNDHGQDSVEIFFYPTKP